MAMVFESDVVLDLHLVICFPGAKDKCNANTEVDP